MTRNKALLFLIPVIVIVVLVLALPLFIDKDNILDLAAKTVKERTGATLKVDGPVDLKVFPRIGVDLQDASLTMPEADQPSLEVGSLVLDLRLLSLLTGKVELTALYVDKLVSRVPAAPEEPGVDTSAMTDAELDAYYAKRRAEQAEAGAAAASGALAVPLALNVRVLDVGDSRIELLSEEGVPATTVKIETLLARDLNLNGQPIFLQANIELLTEQTIAIGLDGELRFDEAQQLVLIDTLEVGVTGATPSPINLSAEGQFDVNRQIADLQLKLSTGDSEGKGTLRYAAFESPNIDAVMHFNQLDPAMLVIAGPEAAASADTPASGDDPLPLQALREIDTKASLRVDKAIIGAHSINDIQGELRAVDGIIKLQPLTATAYGGALSMQATFDGKHNTAVLDTSGTLSDLDIGEALSVESPKPAATGKANLNWTLSGRGRTSNELLENLAGPIQLTTSDTVLQAVGIEGMLCRAVALTNQESLTTAFPNNTAFTDLSATIQLADGQAKLSPLTANLAHVALSGNGDYNLLSQDFDVTLEAKLSPELETLDKACRVSKRLTAIDWPVVCKGNAEGEPAGWCKVDTQSIIEDMARDEAGRQIKEKAGKLLDKLFN
ncbi:MAG: AsmA family protein [Pseudomonadota bacterium]